MDTNTPTPDITDTSPPDDPLAVEAALTRLRAAAVCWATVSVGAPASPAGDRLRTKALAQLQQAARAMFYHSAATDAPAHQHAHALISGVTHDWSWIGGAP